MKKISISNDFSKINEFIQLGCIQYETKVEKYNEDLWNDITHTIHAIEKEFTLESIGNERNIRAARKIYKTIGKDPYRYRVSSEALIRRIVQGKGLYKINNVVDCNNFISINTKLSVGSYDNDRIGDNLIFRIGEKNESYKGIGKELINIENLPVFADESGAYGSPTSDSEKAMITLDTKNVLTVLISFDNNFDMEKEIVNASDILKKYANATNVETSISKNF